MNKDFWGTAVPVATHNHIPKISKKRKVCVECGNKWVIEYDPSKPLLEYILCPDCRTDKLQI